MSYLSATFISADSFSVIDDYSTDWPAGTRIKADCGDDGIKFSNVLTAVFSGGVTTVTLKSSVLTSNISGVQNSITSGDEGGLPEHSHSDMTDGGVLGGYEEAGVAASTMTAHTDNHPAPTTRDSRNEAAGVAASVMSNHTSNHPAPTVRDERNCANDDERLSDARQASDVYEWAKEATKPAYNLSEISETETLKQVTADEKTAWNGKEPGLGEPLVDDYVLSSKTDGTRSWKAPGSRILAGRIPFGNGDDPLTSDANFVYKNSSIGLGTPDPITQLSNISTDTGNWGKAGIVWRVDVAAYAASFINRNVTGQAVGVRIHTEGKNPGGDYPLIISSGAGNGVGFLYVRGDGKLGVGTSQPTTSFHSTGPIRVGSYTVATVPSASSSGAGSMIYITDDVGGAVGALSDGTNWRRTTDRAIVSTT